MREVDPDWLARLKAALSYDPEAGEFRWRVSRGGGAKAGGIAGTLDSKGHRQIRFEMRLHLAHRLAWVLTHGRWPDGEIDHINRVRSDNRLANLRECSHAENSKNSSVYRTNSSGHPGVSWDSRTNRWKAYVGSGKDRKNLGSFKEKADAVAARQVAEREHYGEFAPVFHEAEAA